MTGGLSLASIELGWNHMNQQAVEEFADALAWNKSITKVLLPASAQVARMLGVVATP